MTVGDDRKRMLQEQKQPEGRRKQDGRFETKIERGGCTLVTVGCMAGEDGGCGEVEELVAGVEGGCEVVEKRKKWWLGRREVVRLLRRGRSGGWGGGRL